ncbi:hypothetical protein [Mycolicibacterium sp.]|uniref:hypothetical protein n=1 Tax=Mycolicibacterium sp. TaxID=2320850 RepID=UPI003D0F7845
MRDEAPELTRPGGIDDDRRWWIDTDEPWDWTLWRSDDGLAVLEVLRSGWSFTTASAVLDTAQLAAFTRDGIAALDDLLVKLRHG